MTVLDEARDTYLKTILPETVGKFDVKTYKPAKTLYKFHKCNDRVRGIIGPYGSGKSVASVMEIYERAKRQAPDRMGIRRTKIVVVRNTAGELRDTTMQTLLEWMPDGEVGTLYTSVQNMRFELGMDKRGNIDMLELPDGTRVHCTILFRALDKPEQQKKLLSLEATFAWFNEFREIPLPLVIAMIGRLGRYPGKTTTWKGIWMDSNPFDEGSAYDKFFEGKLDEGIARLAKKHKKTPPKITLFEQPGGMDRDAENLENLQDGRGYYLDMLATAKVEGQDDGWVNVHVHGKRGFLSFGLPVFAKQFNERWHVSPVSLTADPSLPIAFGMDFGLDPCCLFGQKTQKGQWRILAELIGEQGMGALQFGPVILDFIRQQGWGGWEYQGIGDPSAVKRNESDGKSALNILSGMGLHVRPSRVQDPVKRVEAVRSALVMNTLEGQPGILIDPKVKVFRKALAGGYKYRKMKTREERYELKPEKNYYSHICDAGQYLIVDYDGVAVTGGAKRPFKKRAVRGSDWKFDTEFNVYG